MDADYSFYSLCYYSSMQFSLVLGKRQEMASIKMVPAIITKAVPGIFLCLYPASLCVSFFYTPDGKRPCHAVVIDEKGTYFTSINIPTATSPPAIGPITGIQAYFQSLSRLRGMGRIAWAIRGPKSRAGLMAYPVGPPNERPTPNTSNPAGSAFKVPRLLSGFDINKTPRTNIKVPIASVRKLKTLFLIAGPVENTASFASPSSVASKCCL